MTGYVYAMRRNPFGSWCGYVCVPRRHPWWGLEDHDDEQINVEVHGGITMSGPEIMRDHPQEGAWWIGFDCGHAFDIQPGLSPRVFGRIPDEAYRDLAYVRAQVLRLAIQLRTVEIQSRGSLP